MDVLSGNKIFYKTLKRFSRIYIRAILRLIWARGLYRPWRLSSPVQVPEIRQNQRTALALLGILGMAKFGLYAKAPVFVLDRFGVKTDASRSGYMEITGMNIEISMRPSATRSSNVPHISLLSLTCHKHYPATMAGVVY